MSTKLRVLDPKKLIDLEQFLYDDVDIDTEIFESEEDSNGELEIIENENDIVVMENS